MAKWKYIEERLDLKTCEKLHSNHHSNHHSIRGKYRYELVEKSKKWCYRTFRCYRTIELLELNHSKYGLLNKVVLNLEQD